MSRITYDADGSLTGDSLWSYVWDGENRLVEMSMKTGTGISGTTRKRMLFDYDYDYDNGAGGWTLDYTRRFVYDGWNLIAELDGSNNRIRTYVWGTDLSGSQQGAGGVGGLLMVTQFTPSVTHHFVAYDGNGNVAGLVNAADGKYSARYAYGPFGEPLRVSATGAMDKNNPFRFSTKYTDDESGLLYYGYRYYDPNTGRWPNRDPIGERGGNNLYCYVANDSANHVDKHGLTIVTRESSQVFRDAILAGLEKITDTSLCWLHKKDRNDERWVLATVRSGNGEVWNDLNAGIGGFKDYRIVRTPNINNAEGEIRGIFSRTAWINENVAVDLPVEDGVDLNGKPKYKWERAPFEIVLWHELVGHAIKGLDHPAELWNTDDSRNMNPLPSNWGKVDPTIVIENMARLKLQLEKGDPSTMIHRQIGHDRRGSIIRLFALAISIFWLDGCQTRTSTYSEISPEMRQILDRRRTNHWELDTSGLNSAYSENAIGKRDSDEVFWLPTRPNIPDAFRYQLIWNREERRFWIIRRGGVSGRTMIFGPGEL